MSVNNNNMRALRRLLKSRGWVWDEIKDLPLGGLQAALSGPHALEGWRKKEAKRLLKAAKKAASQKTLLSKQGKPLKRVEGILSLPRFSEGAEGVLIENRVFVGVPTRKALEKKAKEMRALKEELEGLNQVLQELLPQQSVLPNTPQWFKIPNGKFALNLAARKVLGSEGQNCIGRYSGSSLIYEDQIWGAFTRGSITQWEHWQVRGDQVTLIEAKEWDNAAPRYPQGIALKEEVIEALQRVDKSLPHPFCPKGWSCQDGCRCQWERPRVEEKLQEALNQAHNYELLSIKTQKSLMDKVRYPHEEEETSDFEEEVWVVTAYADGVQMPWHFPGFLSFEEVAEEFHAMATTSSIIYEPPNVRKGRRSLEDYWPKRGWVSVSEGYVTTRAYRHHLSAEFEKRTIYHNRAFLRDGEEFYKTSEFPEMEMPQGLIENFTLQIQAEVLAHRPVMA